MELMTINGRPSTLPAALPAVHAQVPGAHVALAASVPALVAVGQPAVRWAGQVAGTSQIQAQQQVRVEGRSASTYGRKAKDTATIEMIFGDVRGVPPRGRPV
ncbi:hypothetical protein ACNTMW_20055 [Planosporangium sp. 12N6]|uniref:hypothetical protein n=1 Tax=Planosporangium spinosum TaxID=3402278 RepID=UPI003CF1A60B